MVAYYNENDPYAAKWLENLISAGAIASGVVDTRSIVDVQPDDLVGFAQCHFFAGIGGWSYALRLAGWPDDRPVWTGSCPCQPFSVAGKRRGADDERHLWFEWRRLVRECVPATIFGEQVEAAVRAGWLDLVSTDLEAEGYAIGAAVLGAHSAGAPHIRQRVWFVANTNIKRRAEHSQLRQEEVGRNNSDITEAAWGGTVGDSALEYPGGIRRERGQEACRGDINDWQASGRQEDTYGISVSGSHWSGCGWVDCRDGKARPVESGSFPLANGIPGRVGRLRAYGNAIVPQVAAEFIAAYLNGAA